MKWLPTSLLGLSLFACHGGTASTSDASETSARDDAGFPPDAGVLPVEIGIPDEISSSTFVELDEEGDVRIQDGGQGGTHALVALRFEDLGNWIFYEIGIRNLEGDGGVQTPSLVRPRPVPCDESMTVCRLSPVFVVLGGLADKSEWDGLHVEIHAEVWNEDGVRGAGTRRAYLRR